jgi:hypothetical protein
MANPTSGQKTNTQLPISGTGKYSRLAITGLVLAFIVPPLGLILSIIALIRINKHQQKGNLLAVLGIVFGVFLTLALAYAAIFAFAVYGSSVRLTFV